MGVGGSLRVRCRRKNVHVRYLIYWWVLILHLGDFVIMLPYWSRPNLAWDSIHTWSTLTRQILSECIHCIGFRWPKATNLDKFWHLGVSCTDLLLPMKAKFGMLEQTHGLRLDAKFRLDRLFWFMSPSGGENPQILPFYWLRDLWCRQLAAKVEHGCTTTNLPLSIDIKIVSVLQRLHGEIVRTNSDIQKYEPQSRFARLWLDTIIAQSDAHNQNMYR